LKTPCADQQIFPIAQDRWVILAFIAFAFIGVPLLVDEYMFRAILIPFLILALAALGVNILVGYCGQISLGSGAFMAVGAYMAYNTYVRIEGTPLIIALLSGGFFATLVGIFFGIPSLRVKGLYLAVATLAAQFFCDWAFLRIGWFTNNTASGSVSVSNLNVLGWTINTPMEKYLFCLGFLVVFALLAKNLVRSAIGREWMAIRDMDVAAAVIGIRPMYAKLSAFAVSSFIIGVAGGLWGFVHLGSWEPAAFSIDRSFQLLFMVIIGGMGSITHLPQPVPARGGRTLRRGDFHRHRVPHRVHGFRRAHRLVPDRGAPRSGQALEHRQTEVAALALSALRPQRRKPSGIQGSS